MAISYDNYSSTDTFNALNIQTISSDTTTTGNVIDTGINGGYKALKFVLKTGAYTSGKATPVLYKSKDNIT